MKLSVWMVIKSVITFVFGVAFVFVPKQVMGLYDVVLEQGGVFMTQLFGAAFILIAIMLFFARKDKGSQALNAIVLAVFIGDFVGFVVALIGQMSGFINMLGWITVALYFILAAFFGYFFFKKTGAA
jgi:hypothetical protein